MSIPEDYRNVICPWQTTKELRLAVKFVDQLLRKLKLTPPERAAILNIDKPDRIWYVED